MKQLLIEVSMPMLASDLLPWKEEIERTGIIPSLASLGDMAVRHDLYLWTIEYLMLHERATEAASAIDNIVFDDNVRQLPPLHHAWLWLARMSLFINSGDYILALGSAENALNVLISITNKRQEDFLAIVASLLYNLAYVHHATKDNGRAVKELTRAQKLFERLVKRNNNRFSAMLIYSVEASTTIFKSRVKQMNVLAHYQSTTELYTAMLDEAGDAEKLRTALSNLVDSLKNEGDLMLQMGNARNAVKFYTKALRYQKKLNTGSMGKRELNLSISLARALLRLVNRRDAAEQLLSSLLPLAGRLGATREVTEIEQLLSNRSKNYNIMTMLKGL